MTDLTKTSGYAPRYKTDAEEAYSHPIEEEARLYGDPYVIMGNQTDLMDPARRAAKNARRRQAEYAAKNRLKAKAIRRPDARAVADAYLAAVENGGLERMMRIYLEKLGVGADVDAGSKDIVEIVRNLVRLALVDKGYDNDQIRDKMGSMSNPGHTNPEIDT